MSRRETLCTPLGEMMDMLACMDIYQGNAKQKDNRKWTFDEVIALE